jgi:hypothetical protein
VQKFIELEGENMEMAPYVMPLAKAFMKLQQSTATVAQKGLKNPDEAGAASTDYMRQFALVAMGFMWARMVKVAMEKLEGEPENKEFYEAKLQTANFFFTKMLPEADFRFKSLMSGAEPLMAMKAEAF